MERKHLGHVSHHVMYQYGNRGDARNLTVHYHIKVFFVFLPCVEYGLLLDFLFLVLRNSAHLFLVHFADTSLSFHPVASSGISAGAPPPEASNASLQASHCLISHLSTALLIHQNRSPLRCILLLLQARLL
jgi:hypothetical protein